MHSKNGIPHFLSYFIHFILFSVLKTRLYIFNMNGDMKYKTHSGPLKEFLRANESLSRLQQCYIKIMYAPTARFPVSSLCLWKLCYIFQQPFKYTQAIHWEFQMSVHQISHPSVPDSSQNHSSMPFPALFMFCFCFNPPVQCVLSIYSKLWSTHLDYHLESWVLPQKLSADTNSTVSSNISIWYIYITLKALRSKIWM